jgi:lipopolysaccharide/colanic/teichoic acid biosynthesis glycosyltransferase
LPVFAGLVLAVILDDGPPVFFHQTRVGKNGRPFRIWKFRTMRVGSLGSVITAAGDRRITRVGAALRRLKLDELPEVAEYVHLEEPMWQAVLQVRPGITDLASLLYRNEEELLGAADDPNAFYRESVLPAKLSLNVAYLRSRSFRLDLRLILLTIWYSLHPDRFDPDLIKRTFAAGVGIE